MRVHQPLAVLGEMAAKLARAESALVKIDRLGGAVVADRQVRNDARQRAFSIGHRVSPRASRGEGY